MKEREGVKKRAVRARAIQPRPFIAGILGYLMSKCEITIQRDVVVTEYYVHTCE